MKIKFFSLIKLDLKKSEHNMKISEKDSVLSIIEELDKDYDGYFTKKLLNEGEIEKGTIILLNGKNILHLKGLDTLVGNDDELVLFPPSAGG